jgi:rod shape-determining protein MreC
MPVVGAGGLVGQVVQANHNSATVRLVTDGQSSVGVRYGAGAQSAVAVLTGQGWGKPLDADLVPNNKRLTRGEVFTTSGLNGASYPGGIPVASVSSSRTGATSSQESVTLQPMADLAHLRYVAVVLWGPSS